MAGSLDVPWHVDGTVRERDVVAPVAINLRAVLPAKGETQLAPNPVHVIDRITPHPR